MRTEPPARTLRGLCTMLVEHGLCHGHVDVIAGRATAIWLDHTVALAGPTGIAQRMAALCGPDTATLRRQLELAATRRPAKPHLRLAILAGSGADAAALLAYRHSRLDRASVIAYAEAVSRRAVAVLATAGYERGEPHQLPAGPVIWPMQRLPIDRRGKPARFRSPDFG